MAENYFKIRSDAIDRLRLKGVMLDKNHPERWTPEQRQLLDTEIQKKMGRQFDGVNDNYSKLYRQPGMDSLEREQQIQKMMAEDEAAQDIGNMWGDFGGGGLGDVGGVGFEEPGEYEEEPRKTEYREPEEKTGETDESMEGDKAETPEEKSDEQPKEETPDEEQTPSSQNEPKSEPGIGEPTPEGGATPKSPPPNSNPAGGLGNAASGLEGAGGAAGGLGVVEAGGEGMALAGEAGAAAALPEIGWVVAAVFAGMIIVMIVGAVLPSGVPLSPEKAAANEKGGAEITDGSREELAKKVLAHKNISYDGDINRTDIGPGCESAPIGWSGEKCVQAPVLKFLLAIADAGFKIRVSATIRDHPPYINANSRHLDGMAVDIGNEEVATTLMPWIIKNLLGTSISPKQVLIAGIGGGYVSSLDKQSIDGGKVFPYFTSKYVGDHKDHIHVGY